MKSRHCTAYSPREGDSPFLEIREESPAGGQAAGQNWRTLQHDSSPNLSITLQPSEARDEQIAPGPKYQDTLFMDASPILLTIASEESASPPSEYVVGHHRRQARGDVTIESVMEMDEFGRPRPNRGASDEKAAQRSPSAQTIGGLSKSSSRTPAPSISPERPLHAKRLYSVPPQLLLRGAGNHLPAPQHPSSASESPRDDTEHLRKTLILSQARARVLEEELQRAKGALNDTSLNVTVRETECLELNGLVDTLQAEVAQLKKENLMLRQSSSAAADNNRYPPSRGVEQRGQLDMASYEMKLTELEESLCEKETAVHYWMQQHDTLARELALSKLRIAQQQAVLDRLDLHPPYPEELIGSARLKKNLFVAL